MRDTNLPQLPRTMTSAQVAQALNRQVKTVQRWAWTGKGPIQPLRINGRLAWREADLAAVLNGQEVEHGC